jgi:hypothetical protein
MLVYGLHKKVLVMLLLKYAKLEHLLIQLLGRGPLDPYSHVTLAPSTHVDPFQ